MPTGVAFKLAFKAGLHPTIWQHDLFIEHCSQSKEHGIGLPVAKPVKKGSCTKHAFKCLIVIMKLV